MAAVTATLLLPTAADASTPGQNPDWQVGGAVDTRPPQSAYADFANCPDIDAFPLRYADLLDENGNPVLDEFGDAVPDVAAGPIGRGIPDYCVVITAYNGRIQFGGQEFAVDPINITIGINTAGDIAFPAGGGGEPTAIKIPGGILGIPELDPLWDASLGLLSVSATPHIGNPAPGNANRPYDPNCEGLDCLEVDPAAQFGAWLIGLEGLGGSTTDGPIELTIPLSVQLNNLLFGPNCRIPEFHINLTTGTTQPPAGVEPLTGDKKPGGRVTTSYRNPDYQLQSTAPIVLASRIGARFVDNTFAVPGARQCDLLLGGLLNQPRGLFDGLINGQVGLPSPAGANTATFDVDVNVANYGNGFLYGAVATPRVALFGITRQQLEFGDVAVGSSKTLTATLTNAGSYPMMEREFQTAVVTGAAAGQYEITANTCARPASFPTGGSCTIDVTFTPTSTGAKAAQLRPPLGVGPGNGDNGIAYNMTGRGI